MPHLIAMNVELKKKTELDLLEYVPDYLCNWGITGPTAPEISTESA